MEIKLKDSGIPWIGAIPQHWERLNMKRNVSFHKGSIPKQWSDVPLEIPYLSMDYLRGRGDGSTLFPIHDSSLLIANENDLLVLWDGANAGEFIRSKYGYVGSTMAKLSYNPEKLNHDYLFFFLKSLEIVSKDFANGTTIPHFTPTFLAGNYPIPPLEEQKQIAAWLDSKCYEIDELIEVEQQMISELEASRQAVITEAVTHGLNPDVPMTESGCDWFTSHPVNWKIERIKNLFAKRAEKNNPIKTKERLSLSIDKGITLYADKTTNLDRFKDDFTQYQLAHPNDIVLNSMNMIVGAVGKSAYYGCVSPVYYVIYGKSTNVDMDYYGYLLNIPLIRDVYHKLGQGIYAIERGDGRVNTCRLKVDYYEFSMIHVPVPSVEEQTAIANYLNEKNKEIDELIKVKQEKIETLKQYRQSLIFEAVTGKTKVN